MNRRHALKTTAFGLGALALSPACGTTAQTETDKTMAGPVSPLGIQLFTIPMLVDQDLRGTLKQLSDIGYREIEFFGPYPASSAAAKAEWAGFSEMIGVKNHAYWGSSVEEVAGMMQEFGLNAPSMHADLLSMRTGMTELLDGLAPLKPKYVVLPALMEGRDSLDDYKRLAEEFNGFGEQMAAYDMKFVYHNHGYEHIEMDGQIPMNFLLENTEGDKVQFELDVFWMSAAGADPIKYLQTYKGRYVSLHIKDASEPFRFSGDGGSPDQWMAGFPKMADPGSGILDIAGFMKTGRESGVDHFFLERDLTPTPKETLEKSFAFLRKV